MQPITEREDFKKKLHKTYFPNGNGTDVAARNSFHFEAGAEAAQSILQPEIDAKTAEIERMRGDIVRLRGFITRFVSETNSPLNEYRVDRQEQNLLNQANIILTQTQHYENR